MDGWIKLHRGILDWEWFSDPNTLAVFMYLLVSARYEDGIWKGIEVKAGQCPTSVDTIGKFTKLSRQQIRTALSHLQSTNEITIKSTNQFTMVTINKYDTYQANFRDNQPTEQPTTNQQSNQRPTNGQEKEKKNQEKNKEITRNKDVKNISPSSSPKGFDFAAYLINAGVPKSYVDDFMDVRRKKRANNSETAMNALVREAKKANISLTDAVRICAENSWQSFQARYIEGKRNSQPSLFDDSDMMVMFTERYTLSEQARIIGTDAYGYTQMTEKARSMLREQCRSVIENHMRNHG